MPQAPRSTANRVSPPWLDRVIEAASARDDYNDASEKDATLAYLREARAKFQAMAGGH